MLINFSITSKARLFCGILFTIGAYAGHILSILLWINQLHAMSVFLWIVYAFEKCLNFLRLRLSQQHILLDILVNIFDVHLIYIPGISTLPPSTYSPSPGRSLQLYSFSSLIRFLIPLWLMNFSVFVTPQFHHHTFPDYLEYLTFIFYTLCVIHSSLAMYICILEEYILQTEFEPLLALLFDDPSYSREYDITFSRFFCMFL